MRNLCCANENQLLQLLLESMCTPLILKREEATVPAPWMEESNRTIQPATKSVPPPICLQRLDSTHSTLPPICLHTLVAFRVESRLTFENFGRIQDPAAGGAGRCMHCHACALCSSCQTASNVSKKRPSARIEKPCDHKESQKSSVDAHIDSQSRMLRHTPHASPPIIAISYISCHGESSSPTAASAQSMSIKHNTPSISE